jgi:peroxiredoxin Q/BCP
VVQIASRNTFIINPDGRVAKVYSGVNPAHHSDEVLADLDRLQK